VERTQSFLITPDWETIKFYEPESVFLWLLTGQGGCSSAAGGGRFAGGPRLHLLQLHLQVACVQEQEQGRRQRHQRQQLARPAKK